MIAPHSPAELAAWQTAEAARRATLDAAVRAWLTHGQWPATLDATDAYLLRLRLHAATTWLDLGRCGLVADATPPTLLEGLLLAGWSEYFLEQHCRRLSEEMSSYILGRERAGCFAA